MMRVSIFALLLILLSASCASDTTLVEKDLEGRWNVSKTIRNGKETTLLDNAYFEFKSPNLIKYNMTGNEKSREYVLSENIITEQVDQKLQFEIAKPSADSMRLKSTIMDQLFEFHLVRTKPIDER